MAPKEHPSAWPILIFLTVVFAAIPGLFSFLPLAIGFVLVSDRLRRGEERIARGGLTEAQARTLRDRNGALMMAGLGFSLILCGVWAAFLMTVLFPLLPSGLARYLMPQYRVGQTYTLCPFRLDAVLSMPVVAIIALCASALGVLLLALVLINARTYEAIGLRRTSEGPSFLGEGEQEQGQEAIAWRVVTLVLCASCLGLLLLHGALFVDLRARPWTVRAIWILGGAALLTAYQLLARRGLSYLRKNYRVLLEDEEGPLRQRLFKDLGAVSIEELIGVLILYWIGRPQLLEEHALLYLVLTVLWMPQVVFVTALTKAFVGSRRHDRAP